MESKRSLTLRPGSLWKRYCGTVFEAVGPAMFMAIGQEIIILRELGTDRMEAYTLNGFLTVVRQQHGPALPRFAEYHPGDVPANPVGVKLEGSGV